MAVVWAQTGQKVLLIDADLRRPTLKATFNQSNHQGLTTVLTSQTGSVDLGQIIHPSGIDNLDILTAGPIPPNPAELLNSQRMRTLIDGVKDIYDMVIIDVPPMLEVTDAQVISRYVDAMVLVVKQNQTQKLGVNRSVELLKLAHANLLGFVMNDINADGDTGYGYGYGEETSK